LPDGRGRISHHDYFAKAVKLIYSLIGETTEHGFVFRMDLALRPNGNSGLLVSRFEAYADYQQQRGSNTAWTWEHQAMTRARCCLGAPELRARFDAVRCSVIHAVRDHAALAQEILAMRHKLRAARPVKAPLFDVKHSTGGMVDVEFAVQYLVLAFSHTHPSLSANLGNIALLHNAEQAGLLPPGVGTAAADAYRELRKVQHTARLDEQPTQVSAHDLLQERAAVVGLWAAVFGAQTAHALAP
jgi:glutamate-ammonia-ligase adenylyltransferase